MTIPEISATRRPVLSLCLPLLMAFGLGTAQADLSALEGTVGHAPAGGSPSLWDLEGDTGHAAAASEPRDDGIRCAGEGPCVEVSTELALRVLPRPFSHVYAERQADESAIIQANVAAFRPLYVFAREGVDLDRGGDPEGWYQVGQGRDAPLGWMQARDVFEWRQALLVSYTHPGDPIEGRSPVLMFQDLASLESLVDDMDMAGRARSLYTDIREGEVPESVVSMEPERFVDITRQFYMLPILDWEQTRIRGDDARLLQLAAAVPRARGADTLTNPEYADQSRVGRGEAGAGLQDLKVDLVFVIDTTRSMQPFIDMTRDAVARMTREFTGETSARFRFGLVTFRDSIEVIPALEYVTRNHTPELVDGEALVDLLAHSARATEVGSLDYAEEGFAGVDTALRSAWREDALRFMILVGDASSHPKGHAQNVTGKDEVDLRRELDDAQVHLLAIHLQDPRAEADHPIAHAQFSHLSRVRGDAGRSAIEAVDAFEQAQYLALVEQVTDDINNLLRQAMGGPAGPAASTGQVATSTAGTGDAELESVSALWQAALVEYIGREATPPKDIVAWSLDRDLVNPADRSLDVRVLVTREQLSTLSQSLDRVVQALMRAEVTQAQFFEALQGVAGQTMKQPDEIGQGAQLADTGLLPAFIQSLPYRSDILSLTDEMFASMTTQQRAELEWSLLAKLEQYRAINEQVDVWFQLNDTDDDRDRVYPLHLDYLP
ncbi:VWA domain-containing protein [Ectothiorhodospira haloalkaliphila]|uniref:vWA domain-containing protein n=1 Tax=Ectothiorhodospira haloalkaliphila TaxID=421628 RepID=UPI001EE92B4F|nr:vWA domain-containing protein [Ectothiorhodospira haloalkaliphila]MCG5524034.1 VWA domain-containing protein [Ectothiorhodospira haloalkaliphila]